MKGTFAELGFLLTWFFTTNQFGLLVDKKNVSIISFNLILQSKFQKRKIHYNRHTHKIIKIPRQISLLKYSLLDIMFLGYNT